MLRNIFQDWLSNTSNVKARIILILYRLAHVATYNRAFFILLVPYLVIYRVIVEWILCCEIPYKTKIGKGLSLFHGQALVINDNTEIGSYCTIRHSTTIGSKMLSSGIYSSSPIIGNNVDIGSNVCIIGPIRIGNDVKIGAGSVVVKDVPNNAIVVGNPARVIGFSNPSYSH